jgi:hypothetical protein
MFYLKKNRRIKNMNNGLKGFIKLEKRDNELIKITVFTELKDRYHKKESILVFSENLMKDIIEQDIQNFITIRHCNKDITALNFYFLENNYNAENHNIRGKWYYCEIKTSEIAAFIAGNTKKTYIKCNTKPLVKVNIDNRIFSKLVKVKTSKFRLLNSIIQCWIRNESTLKEIALYPDFDMIGFTKIYNSDSNMYGGLYWHEARYANRFKEKKRPKINPYWSSHT